jgi:23S rRNA pseudouridine955/2504/2580 synthase
MFFNHIKLEKNINQTTINFLKKYIYISINKIYKYIREKKITINKKKCILNYKIKKNDILNINLDIKINIASNFKTFILKNIIYETDDFIIINKIYGLSVHDGTNVNENLIDNIKNNIKYKNSYIELCHRLDKTTSGCLVLSKTKNFLIDFQKMLYLKQISKEYIAIVKHHINKKLDIILNQNILNKYNKKIKSNSNITFSRVNIIRNYDVCSLIKISLITGKNHQIRIHLAHQDNPIINDKKYDKFFFISQFEKFFTRIFLHSHKLKFICPITKKYISVTSKYDNQFKNILKYLQRGSK